MPLPVGLSVTTVTGTFLDAAGNAQGGTITFTPSAELTDTAGLVVVTTQPVVCRLTSGAFTSPPLAATDNSALLPSGWAYTVTASLTGQPLAQISVLLPSSPSTVDFTALIEVTTLTPVTAYLTARGGALWGPLILGGSPPLRIPASAAAGSVLTSDSSGNAGWGPITATEIPAATTSAIGGLELASDLAGTATAPHVVATHLASALPLAQGGTAGTTQQGAINSLTGAQSAGKYLRSDGTNAALTTIQGADVPTLNQNTTGTAGGLSVTLGFGSGGTGQTAQQAAINALSGTQSSGKYLRSDGTNATLAAIQAGDVPTLNQSTSGTAAGLSSTLAAGSGGTGQTSASAAFNALSPNTTLGDVTYGSGTNTSTRLAGNTSSQVKFFSQTGTGSVSATPAWAVVSGQLLRTPNSYAPGTQTSLNVTTTTMAAFSSGNACTGSFTAPASGSVLVTASFVAAVSAANTFSAFGLAATGTVTPLIGSVVVTELDTTTANAVQTPQFLVTGLTSGTSYNFDLLGATTSATTTTILAFSQTSTTPALSSAGRGAPVLMTVQAV